MHCKIIFWIHNILKTQLNNLCFYSELCLMLYFIPVCPAEDEKNIVERNVSTSGVSIYFEAYLYNANSYTNTQWHLPPLNLGSFQRRLSTATEDEDEDSPSDSPTPEKLKKPKKVYCYVSPKVRILLLSVFHSGNNYVCTVLIVTVWYVSN